MICLRFNLIYDKSRIMLLSAISCSFSVKTSQLLDEKNRLLAIICILAIQISAKISELDLKIEINLAKYNEINNRDMSVLSILKKLELPTNVIQLIYMFSRPQFYDLTKKQIQYRAEAINTINSIDLLREEYNYYLLHRQWDWEEMNSPRLQSILVKLWIYTIFG